ncbi:MAG TPA: formate dehydrogenase, partial [Candidatus Acidoferrum sp.]|nr:formate dehydrogenase [Candidatus Acidoferrum sp.]
NYVINSERWNKDPFFKTFVVNYTNAATLLREDFKDTEDLDGAFSGLEPAKGGVAEWPFNGFINQYNRASWEYAREKPPAVSPKPVELKPGEGFAPLVASLVWPPPLKDETLQNPRCVFQTVKRHFARYTPEMVEKATGCPKETFPKVAETILANSGADRTTSFAYAVAWTQHTYGVQIIGACALL